MPWRPDRQPVLEPRFGRGVARGRGELPSGTVVIGTEGPRGGERDRRGARGGDVDAIYVFSGDGKYNEVLNGERGRLRSVSCRAAARACCLVCSAWGAIPSSPRGCRSRGAAADRARTGQREAVLLRRGDRVRRRAGAADRPAWPRRGGPPAGRLAFMREAVGMSGVTSGRFPPAAGDRGGRTRSLRVRRGQRSVHVRRPGPGQPRPGRVVRPRARSRARLGAWARGRFRDSCRPRARRASRSGPSPCSTTPSGSWSGAIAPMPLQVDGEDLGDVEHATFEAERDAVTALVPAEG